MRENPGVQWRVGCVNRGIEPLNDAWVRVRSPMVSRVPRVYRSAQDDLSGTFTNVIGEIFAAVMQMVVVCTV